MSEAISPREATIRVIGDDIIRISNVFGPNDRRGVIEGLAILLVAAVSKSGEQSVACPLDLVVSEADAVIDYLEGIFGEIK